MARRLIDGHYHLSRTVKDTVYENLNDLLRYIRCAQLDAVCVHNILLWKEKMLLRNPLSLLAKAAAPGKIYAFGGVIYPEPEKQWEPWDWAEQAKALLEAGFDGIKILNKPLYRKEWTIPYYHENFDAFWAYLQEQNVPVMFHIGDPKEFWDINRMPKRMYDFGWFYGKETPGYQFFYEETEKLLQKFPDLNLTIPHFYFLSDDLDRLEDFMERHPKILLDITPGSEMYFNFSICHQQAREFFIKYQNRILFGTDNYGGNEESSSEEELKSGIQKIQEMKGFLEQEYCLFNDNPLHGLALPEETLDAIYSGNFLRWAGETPVPVKKDLALAMAKDYVNRTGDRQQEEAKEIVRQMERVFGS